MAQHNDFGQICEDRAAAYLMARGYVIRNRNWRLGHKEIDIIAENDATLIFVEVKARTNYNNQLYHYGHRPCDAVNKQKQISLML